MQWKYITLVVNEKRFIQHAFGEDRVEKKSSFSWYALENNVRTDNIKVITRAKVRFGDSIYNIAGLMDEKEDAYFVDDGKDRIMSYSNTW